MHVSVVFGHCHPPWLLSPRSDFNIFFPASHPHTPHSPHSNAFCFLSVCCFFVCDPLRLIRTAGMSVERGYLPERGQFTSDCTPENMTSSPPATINCQWHLREGWTLMDASPILVTFGSCQGSIPRDWDVYNPLSSTLVLFISQTSAISFDLALTLLRVHELCDWLRGLLWRWSLPFLLHVSDSTKFLLPTGLEEWPCCISAFHAAPLTPVKLYGCHRGPCYLAVPFTELGINASPGTGLLGNTVSGGNGAFPPHVERYYVVLVCTVYL